MSFPRAAEDHGDKDSGAPGRIRAVDGVNLSVHPRQTLAVVGESGCGKSVTALSILRLVPQPQGRIERGSILWQGRDLLALSNRRMREVRGRDIAMIFQEPMTSLNPVFTIGDQVIEAILLHQRLNRKEAAEIALEAMHEVGIPQPAQRLRAYPHQFSGGMRQRAMIAMALACRPKLLLADEPTTALDVTIQAQILDLLRRLQRERGMGMMLITHDLGVVAQNADVVCVMYAGRVVEYARVFDLFERSLHPYTRALLRCKPALRERTRRLVTVGEIMADPGEFLRFPARSHDVMPWWPRPRDSAASADAGTDASSGNVCQLCEIEPDHWVGCRSEGGGGDAHAARRPDLDFRRDSA